MAVRRRLRVRPVGFTRNRGWPDAARTAPPQDPTLRPIHMEATFDIKMKIPPSTPRLRIIVAIIMILACVAITAAAARTLMDSQREAAHRRAIANLETHWGIPFPYGAAEVSGYEVEIIDPVHRLTIMEVVDTDLLRGTFFDPSTFEYAALTSEQRELVSDVLRATKMPRAVGSDAFLVNKHIEKRQSARAADLLLVAYDPIGSGFYLFEKRWYT